jgi:hypothetical protein
MESLKLDQIRKGISDLIELGLEKLEGNGFKVYWVGNNLVRVDIRIKRNE